MTSPRPFLHRCRLPRHPTPASPERFSTGVDFRIPRGPDPVRFSTGVDFRIPRGPVAAPVPPIRLSADLIATDTLSRPGRHSVDNGLGTPYLWMTERAGPRGSKLSS